MPCEKEKHKLKRRKIRTLAEELFGLGENTNYDRIAAGHPLEDNCECRMTEAASTHTQTLRASNSSAALSHPQLSTQSTKMITNKQNLK